jgi:hypothetical protein
MSIARRQIADSVAEKFLPAKRQSVEAAASAYECVATLITARLRARGTPDFGADILDLARQAADASFEAQERFYKMHALIAPIRAEWAIPPGAHGPDDTVPNEKKYFLTAVDSEAA